MSAPFINHRDAALAILASGTEIGWRAGQFCGGIMFNEVLTERQAKWLAALLIKADLPPLADGGEG